MLIPTIFREYDIRGIADEELPDPGIEVLGQAIGTFLRRNHGDKVNLGRDCRLSSERLRNALMSGLKAAGCHVTDIGVVPTPVLYYSAVLLNGSSASKSSTGTSVQSMKYFRIIPSDMDISLANISSGGQAYCCRFLNLILLGPAE